MSRNFNLTSGTPENSQKCRFLKIIKITFLSKNWGIFTKYWVKNIVSWCIWVILTLCIGFQYLLATFFSYLPKMVHFWLNWKCSLGGFTISSTFLQQILRNLSRKISMEKKFLDISPGPRGTGGQIAIFVNCVCSA